MMLCVVVCGWDRWAWKNDCITIAKSNAGAKRPTFKKLTLKSILAHRSYKLLLNVKHHNWRGARVGGAKTHK